MKRRKAVGSTRCDGDLYTPYIPSPCHGPGGDGGLSRLITAVSGVRDRVVLKFLRGLAARLARGKCDILGGKCDIAAVMLQIVKTAECQKYSVPLGDTLPVVDAGVNPTCQIQFHQRTMALTILALTMEGAPHPPHLLKCEQSLAAETYYSASVTSRCSHGCSVILRP